MPELRQTGDAVLKTPSRLPGNGQSLLSTRMNRRSGIRLQRPAMSATIACLAWVLPVTACQKEIPSKHQPRPPTSSAPAARDFDDDWDKHRFDHALWNTALARHVDDKGNVDYAGIGRDRSFDEYLHRLANTDAARLADDRQRLAFWINAYNALTLRAVLDTLPADRSKWEDYSIKDQRIRGRSIWKAMEFSVGGARHTLDGIEHNVLRKQDGLRDPRIHVALVCAARGCPHLWNRAYDATAIDEQLTDAMRRFVQDPRQCTIDRASRTVIISKVFKWYASDFTDPRFRPHARTVPAFLGKYVPDADLSKALSAGTWTLEYHDYDWRLNLKR